jgi:Ca2+-binding RTX toxin-like protein
MANLTAHEQLMLELINRARMDPAGEAKRYGISLNEGVPTADTISTSAKQVLAGNDLIGAAAQQHSDWMLANDKFSHFEGAEGSTYYSPFDRMDEAGYTGYSTAGENIAWTGSTGTLNLTQTILALHQALFVDLNYPGRGHRVNMLKDSYREIGVGHETGGGYKPPGYSTSYNASIITTDFGTRGSSVFITGVVYSDTTTNDNFFTVGEQTAGRAVGGSGANDTTGAGGGYELAYASTGNKTITFNLAAADLKVLAKLGTKNIKVDAVNGNEIWTDASSLTSQSTAIKALYALGIAKVGLNGSSTGEKITGNKAGNKLDGNGGKDSVVGGGGKDIIIGGTGKDTLSGGSGDDQFRFESAADSTAAAPDIIKDFGDSGADKIDLSAVFAGTLIYQDENPITGANQVNVTASGSNVIVHVNLDDDPDDEMQIVLSNTTLSSMAAGDFIL